MADSTFFVFSTILGCRGLFPSDPRPSSPALILLDWGGRAYRPIPPWTKPTKILQIPILSVGKQGPPSVKLSISSHKGRSVSSKGIRKAMRREEDGGRKSPFLTWTSMAGDRSILVFSHPIQILSTPNTLPHLQVKTDLRGTGSVASVCLACMKHWL